VAREALRDAETVELGWTSALADIVRDDRDETVGGTRHARRGRRR